jgi:CubicO group peptidase (beta-lactamase class C family)
VGKYLHDWLPADRARTITIQQLLTHTAGLGDYLDRIESDPTIRGARPLSAYRSFVRASSEDATAPGEFRYSNTGYVVLGAVIEAITGRDYFEFVRAEVYAPAGMTRTDSWCVDDLVENRAIGYLRPGETGPDGIASPAWRSNVFVKGARGTSAGGGLSTAGDLLRFSRALVEGRIVKPATVDALLAPRVRFPVGGDYGYGFVVHEGKDGKRAFGHSGGFAGVNAEFKVYGNGAWTLVVLSNISGGVGGIAGVWDGIVARMGSQP